MASFRVLITDRAWPDSSIEQSIYAPLGGEVVEPPATDEATLCELAATCDAVATNWAKVTERVVRAGEGRLRAIGRLGIGIDNIAVATATELGLPVCNCPDYCIDEVSDHALGMLIALSRKIAFFHLRTKRGEYNLAAGGMLQRLRGQTLGLVGLGRTAQALVPKARALGLVVVSANRSGNDYGTGCEMVSFDELLRRSDFISLHAPLTPETRHLFGRDQFRAMKPTAHLINTSRGALIDEAALYEAIQAGEIAGAALDVFNPEPPNIHQPLFQDERVLVTPHAAFISQQSLDDMRRRVALQLVEALRGNVPNNLVNPDVLGRRKTWPSPLAK